MVRSVGAMKKEAYAAAPTSDRTTAPTSPRFHMTPHSSKRYSPKSHNAVKKTTSNATRNPTPFHCRYGERSSSPDVTSVLAIKMGVNNGSSSKGKSSSRIRACAEIADSAVPAIETPRLPRKNTSTSQGSTRKTGTLYITAKTGSSKSSVSRRNRVLATSFARKIAKGSETERRNALSVSLFCSRRKHDCNIKDAAKRNASQRRPAPNLRDSSEVGSKEKLKSTMTIRTKTVVVVRSSRERNSVRSSLPSRTVVLESSAIHAFAKARTDRKFAPVRVSATTAPASSWIARVASVETSDSPCRLIKIVRPESLKWRSVSANQCAPCGSSPVVGSSRRTTAGSFRSARAMATR